MAILLHLNKLVSYKLFIIDFVLISYKQDLNSVNEKEIVPIRTTKLTNCLLIHYTYCFKL